MAELNDVRFPIGKYAAPRTISQEDRRYAVLTLAELPSRLREALRSLDEQQVETPYREGGWTVRQVVHHLADSHMVAFHRIRRALTETEPVVPPYDEKAFAMLPDSVSPVEWSLGLVENLHARWIMLLQSLEEEQWKRTYKHAERGVTTVEATVLLYAWHSNHHVAHITHLRRAQGW